MKKSWISLLILGLCVARVSPRFASQAMNYTILEGDDVTIECIIEGLQEGDMVIWQGNQSGNTSTVALNGRVSGKERKERYSVEGDKSRGQQHLVITNAVVADEGAFTCELFGDNPISQQHRLVVNIPPSVTVTPPGFIAVNLGDPIKLSCNAAGKPTPRVSWAKTGGNLPDGRPSYVGDDLEIMTSTVDDAGEYFCVAENGVASPATAFVEVLVQYPPSVEVQEGVLHTEVGPSATLALVCDFDGQPPPEVFWRHNTERISLKDQPRLAETNSDGQHILQISGVEEGDLGEYECVGGNNGGEAIGTITIRAEPHGLEIRSEGSGLYSDQYSLDWDVNSHNQLIDFDLRLQQVNETHNSSWGSNVVPAPLHHDYHHTQRYTITALVPDTEYRVELRAHNKYGYSDWVEFMFRTNLAGNTAPPELPTMPDRPSEPERENTIDPEDDSDSYTIVVNPAEKIENGSSGVVAQTSLVAALVVMLMSGLLSL